MYVSAIIPAAGLGSRMNTNQNKQFILLDSKPMIVRTLEVFEKNVFINEIILVVREQEIFYYKKNILNKYKFNKIKSLIAGGKERQHSVFNGLKAVNKNCDMVLIHDGARPFVNDTMILNAINSANEFDAAVLAVPVKDTIKVANNTFVDKTLERDTLWAIQTPQAFKYELIFNAHKKASENNFIGSDDAVLLEKIGIKAKIVMGSYKNIKITTQEDLSYAKFILENPIISQ